MGLTLHILQFSFNSNNYKIKFIKFLKTIKLCEFQNQKICKLFFFNLDIIIIFIFSIQIQLSF